MNNLRQLGLAAHNYESAHGELPYGVLIEPGNPLWKTVADDRFSLHQNTGAIVAMMPFLELGNLADQFDPLAFNKRLELPDRGYSGINKWILGIDHPDPVSPGLGAGVRFGLRERIGLFICPSDTNFQMTQFLVCPIYGIEGTVPGPGVGYRLGHSNPGVTNYVPNIGAICMMKQTTRELAQAGFAGHHGPMRNRDSDSIDQIVDGSSNTLLFGGNVGRNTETQHVRWSWVLSGVWVGRPNYYSQVDNNLGTTRKSYCSRRLR